MLFKMIINNQLMSKTEHIDRIIKAFSENSITAYKIEAETSLTSVGVQKILNKESLNPRQSTLDILDNYLYNKFKYSIDWLNGKSDVVYDKSGDNSSVSNKTIVGKLSQKEEKELALMFLENQEQMLNSPYIKPIIEKVKSDTKNELLLEMININPERLEWYKKIKK